MRKVLMAALPAAIACIAVWGADWAGQSGNPQRDGWARAEKAFTRDNAKNIELLYKFKAENQALGLQSLTSPIVNGNLITYLGFKEMLVFGGSDDNVFSIDADINRIIWKRHFDYQGAKPRTAPTATCPGGLTAALAMPGSSTAMGRGPVAGRGRGTTPGLFATGFGRAGLFLAVSSDGLLHVLNTSTGADRIPPVKFVPPNSKVGSLNLNDGVIYAATHDHCGGNPDTLYALDMNETESGAVANNLTSDPGAGDAAIGSDGTVYARAGSTVLAMTKDLKVTDSVTLPGTSSRPTATPVVFTSNGRELVVAAGPDGRLYLLDAKSLGGADHNTLLYQTEPIAAPDTKYAGNGFAGFSTWEDTDKNIRWIYASLWGPTANSPHGSVVAFKLEDAGGHPKLTRAWTSRDMLAPAPTATANGLVFALSTGESNREAKPNGKPYTVAQREKMASHATLYVLDGETGAELYSSGDIAQTFAHGSGLAVANRRIYFTTHDNTVYAFGFLAEQPQLTGK
jgi:outer membrane protein assembly factor BamB